MPNLTKKLFIQGLTQRLGSLRKLGSGQSLYGSQNDAIRIYIRYSKVHERGRTFYGLRQEDLRELQGRPSFICFLWDDQKEPLLIPFSDYEETLRGTTPATDGQYKAQVIVQGGALELYIAQAGKFNVEGNVGWQCLDRSLARQSCAIPDLSHSQTQTLLGSIGALKGFEVWIPPSDRGSLDWSVAKRFRCRAVLPGGFQSIEHVLQEIDVVWIKRGSCEPSAFFEVEHSTPIYSGLLRFNDIHLIAPAIRPQFTVVADETRRSLFVRQLKRPTFLQSGLVDVCTFLDYANVYQWHSRVGGAPGAGA